MKHLRLFFIFYLLIESSFTHAIDESDVFPELVYKSALKDGNLDKISFYLELGHSSTDKDSENIIPLGYAVKNNSREMINILIKYDALINAQFLDKLTPLAYAVVLSRENLIDILVKHGGNLNSQDDVGRTPLMIAIEKNDLGCVKEILKYKFDKEINDYAGNTIFDYLLYSRNDEIKRLINLLKI